MNGDDTHQYDPRVRDALRALGEEAPSLRPLERLDGALQFRSEPPARRKWVPAIGIALAVGAVSIGVAMATGASGPHPESNADADAGSLSSAADSATSAGQSPSGTIALAAVAGWSIRHVDSCSEIDGVTDHVVFEIQSFDVDCLRKVDRAGTRVFSAPAPDELLGEPLTQVTTVWEPPSPGGHELRRLTGGILAELSSAYVDGVACVDCDRLFVVMGPAPDEVRAIVESVR